MLLAVWDAAGAQSRSRDDQIERWVRSMGCWSYSSMPQRSATRTTCTLCVEPLSMKRTSLRIFAKNVPLHTHAQQITLLAACMYTPLSRPLPSPHRKTLLLFSSAAAPAAPSRHSRRTTCILQAELSEDDYSRLMRRMTRLERIVSDQVKTTFLCFPKAATHDLLCLGL